MSKPVVGFAVIALVSVLALCASAEAADLAAPRRAVEAQRFAGPDDICGCYSYEVRHRVLLSTYGRGFDPNNYDFTEPHYFFGGVKTFRRYSRDPVD